MSRPFELLVFDWDGTLMDSAARIVSCMQAAAADLELEVPPVEAVRNIIGLGLREAMASLFPGHEESLVTHLVARYRHYYLGGDSTPSPLFPGARETLEQLSGEGYLMAVATGKGRPGLNRVLEETATAPLFHATRCADEGFSKPHPDMLLQLLDELGMEPEQALMIGDTEFDLQMAANAGVPGLAVDYGAHYRDRLMAFPQLGCLADIRQLPGWLREQGPAGAVSERRTENG